MDDPALDPGMAGTFTDGYDPEDASTVFSEIAMVTGVSIVCGWGYFDDAGYGGDSEFYVIDPDDTLYELAGDLWPWLSGDIPASSGPGDPSTWKGSRADIDLATIPVWDGVHFAFESQE